MNYGNQIYIKNADGSYREAVYADYFSSEEFYITSQPQYIYTGWQTIDGKTYYFDKTGNLSMYIHRSRIYTIILCH